MRSGRIFLFLLAFLVNGCFDFGEPIQQGPAQPTLVQVNGTATLPKGGVFTSGHSVRLYTMDERAIAAGSIIDDAGSYSLSVPPGSLGSAPVLFHLALKSGNAIVLSAPIRLALSSTGVQQGTKRQDIDSKTTALWLAAKEASQKGSDPLAWNFDRLLKEQSVLDAAAEIDGEVAQWGAAQGNKTLSSAVQGQIDRILAIASKI